MTHPRSAAALAFLARVPRFLLILVVVAVLVGGLILPGVPSAFLLLLIAGLVGWLGWLTWPGQSLFTRVLRVLAVVCFVVLAIQKLLA